MAHNRPKTAFNPVVDSSLCLPEGIFITSITTSMPISTNPKVRYVPEMEYSEMSLRMKNLLIRMPRMEPMGLNAWAIFSRRVAVLGSPMDRIYGLAVVSSTEIIPTRTASIPYRLSPSTTPLL